MARSASQRLRDAVEAGETELGRSYGKALLALGDCLCLLGRRLLIEVQPTEAESSFEEAEECYTRAITDPHPEVVLSTLLPNVGRDCMANSKRR